MSTPAPAATTGFPPLLGRQPRILILGSLPSIRSIQEQQYYGHPRNRFWPVMGRLLAFDPQLDYAQRVQQLTDHGVAVWDVLASGVRPGSLDAHIRRDSERSNPIATLLSQRPSIGHVFFNGRAAQQSFTRHIVLPQAAQPVLHALPSTSPANAAWQLPRLLDAWSLVRDVLNRSSHVAN